MSSTLQAVRMEDENPPFPDLLKFWHRVETVSAARYCGHGRHLTAQPPRALLTPTVREVSDEPVPEAAPKIDDLALIRRDIGEDYIFGKQVGLGGFGAVFEAVEKSTGRHFAVKRMSVKTGETSTESETAKERLRRKGMALREAEALRAVREIPHVVAYKGGYESSTGIDLVMELGEGGSLRKQLDRMGGRMSEEDAKVAMAQVLEGVKGMHDRELIHADIKPDNIICRAPLVVGEEMSPVFISDLGSVQMGKGDRVYRGGVTRFYAAPELLSRAPYGPKVDAFACGVMLTEMVAGRKPFGWQHLDGEDTVDSKSHRHHHDPLALIRDEWVGEPLSEAFYHLTTSLLRRSRHLRLSCGEALEHIWFHTSEDGHHVFRGASGEPRQQPHHCVSTIPLSEEGTRSGWEEGSEGAEGAPTEEAEEDGALSPRVSHGQVGANGPTWLEGAGHDFLDLGGGEALEGVWGELEEEEEVPSEDLDSGGMSAMDPLEEGEGAPSLQASRDEMGEDEARWSEKAGHAFFDLGGGGAELGEALEGLWGEVEEEEGVIYDDEIHPACQWAEAGWCLQEASSPTWVQPYLGVEYRQDEVAEVEPAPCQSFTTDRGQGEGREAPPPRDSRRVRSPLHKVRRWLSAALAKGLGRSASKNGNEAVRADKHVDVAALMEKRWFYGSVR